MVEIAKQLFKLWHIELDARLHPEPLKREYCTQVNETDFDFLSRIFAEEGIHFHLEHGKEKTVVALVNDSRGYNPIAGKEKIPYRDAGGAVTVDHIKSIRRERRVRPGSVAYRDYNFLKPQRETTSREETATPNAPGTLTAREFYEYPGHYNVCPAWAPSFRVARFGRIVRGMSEAETAAKWAERVRVWRASGASAASICLAVARRPRATC